MRVKVVLLALAFATGLAGMAFAAGDPIQARKDIMRNNQEAAKTVFGMIQGQVPYDAAQAAAAMQTLQDDMAEFPTLFPEGSDQGNTHASPAIWQNMEDFKAHAAKLPKTFAEQTHMVADVLFRICKVIQIRNYLF